MSSLVRPLRPYIADIEIIDEYPVAAQREVLLDGGDGRSSVGVEIFVRYRHKYKTSRR